MPRFRILIFLKLRNLLSENGVLTKTEVKLEAVTDSGVDCG